MLKKLLIVIALCMCTVLPIEVDANVGAVLPVDCYIFDQNNKELTLYWLRDLGATGYEVYRSNTMTSDFKKIATINDSTVTKFVTKNPKGRTFRYKVRAYKNVNTPSWKAVIYGTFGEELVVSTKALETKTIGKYIEKNKGINYNFYNLGQRKGYTVNVDCLYSNKYRVMMGSYTSTKIGLRHTSTNEFILTVDRN